ncbi:OstA-like protein [Flavobacteriaceae bacterium]|nr:OstA-like protein [Flavobacteriaceae bacterium]MBL6692968.1 OstA-like protein [Flavobacteriaceae bacterium]MDA8758368.1 OstA-like protein [Flavobacteriaceae bacterium]MDA8762786.1 OstA-like protein [Flavobacteriaceae bacterium]MDB2314018.1 OstA-like protein [Flavobacteriaceae bacterium]
MKKNIQVGILQLIFLLAIGKVVAQEEPKIIKIIQAGGSTQDEFYFPGANILVKKEGIRVHLFHEGALIKSDISYFYPKENFFKANGDVVFTQGDSLKMTCEQIEYDGTSKLAKAWGKVVLERPDMTLKTDTLYLDRANSKAFYNSFGTIVDEKRKLTSIRGTYFMNEKKYRFITRVKIDDPEYELKSQQLDYYTESDKAFFYGKTTIVGEEYDIFCEKGAYDTQLQKGNFQKNAVIFYDNKEIRGDSLYFENERNYAAATNNVSVIDTLNKSVINGHYGEIFKAKDSAIITRRALAINIIDQDSLYIHADTLIATGPPEKKILRGYYDVRIFKKDLRGKSDSLHLDQSTGLIKLLKLPLNRKENQILSSSQKNKKNPILWFGKSQMSGDKIFLISDIKTKKLDSLKIVGNSWIVERDSISETGFNQIKGGVLDGLFQDGKLSEIDVSKNTEVIYYMYSDEENELIGIDKTTCSRLKMITKENEIEDITFFVSPDGDLFPDKDLPINERKLDGFIWREEERPNTILQLFSEEDNQFQPTEIKEINVPEAFTEKIEE